MILRHHFLIFVMIVSYLTFFEAVVSTVSAGSIGGEIRIRPLSDITADGPSVSNINPTYAVLDFTSTIPVACAVVYGTDEAYGQMAVDPDMAGAAMIEHHPVMGNLAPNTMYQYRLQGSDANGNIYISEVHTFTTPGQVSQEVNLAALEAGASIIDVSSNWANGSNHSSFGANKAIDNNENTAWASNGDGDMAFITVQLIQPGLVHAIAIWSREMSDGSSRAITVTARSDQGESYSFSLPDATQSYRFDTPFAQPVETMRFEVDTSTGGNVGFRDVDVLATE